MGGRTGRPWLAYAFCIGLLTTLHSVFLFHLFSTRIGFICLCCVSLYGVNVSIPVLSAWAARRSPLSLVRSTLADLAGWPRALVVTTATFVALLAATIGLQQAYRLHVERAAAAERQRIEEEGGPLVPAGPASGDLRDIDSALPSLFFSEAMAAPPAPQAPDTSDVPNLALFDARGRLVVSKIKALDQKLVLPTGNVPAEEVIRKVASGAEVATIKQMFPYYPATELYGRCAPEFSAKKFDSQEVFTFTGRPSGGRPLLLMFWSSTCKHCQIEVPLLVSWVERHPGRIDVVSVTHIRRDQPGRVSHREITRRYIKDQRIPWTVLEDPDDAIGEVYRSISTPTTYFLTPQGTVVHAWFYAHETGFDQAMEQALAQVGSAAARACLAVPPAPRFALDMLGPDGRKVSLASQLDRPALVHLWATWCAPCMEEIPALLRFGQSLEKSGAGRLVLLSVEDAASGDRIAGFAKKYGLPLRSNRAPSGPLADALDLSYRLPRTYVVAPTQRGRAGAVSARSVACFGYFNVRR